MGNDSFSTNSLLPFFCILLLSCSFPLHALTVSDFTTPSLFQDYRVIQRFKRFITSDPQNITGSWVGPNICEQYKGFYCDYPPGTNKSTNTTVASVDFNGYRLGAKAAHLDEFIIGLKRLAIFHANSNNFRGNISFTNITQLPYIYEIDLSNNKFTGLFPTAVVSVSDILFIDLRFNNFIGPVPRQLFRLGLEVIFLNNNNYHHHIPKNLGSSPVSYLTFANNRFSGPIPTSIRNASETLLEVLFLNNRLEGCLPYEIGYLRNATVFDAGSNKLTGPIPLSFGCLRKVEQLNLAGNRLYGRVPEVVCALATMGNLGNFSLSSNYFTSIGPVCLNLTRKGVLDVRNNCIRGLRFQRSTATCNKVLSKPQTCPPPTFPRPICTLPNIPSALSSQATYHPTASLPSKPAAVSPSPSYASLNRH